MSLFKNKQADLEAKIESLETLNADQVTELETLRAGQVNHDEALANLTKEKETLAVDLTASQELCAELETKIATLTAEAQTVEQAAAEKAIETVSDLGIDPVEEIEEEQPESILEAFEKATPAERIQLFAAQSEQLKAALKK